MKGPILLPRTQAIDRHIHIQPLTMQVIQRKLHPIAILTSICSDLQAVIECRCQGLPFSISISTWNQPSREQIIAVKHCLERGPED